MDTIRLEMIKLQKQNTCKKRNTYARWMSSWCSLCCPSNWNSGHSWKSLKLDKILDTLITISKSSKKINGAS